MFNLKFNEMKKFKVHGYNNTLYSLGFVSLIVYRTYDKYCMIPISKTYSLTIGKKIAINFNPFSIIMN